MNDASLEKESFESYRAVMGTVLHTLNNLISGIFGMAQLAQSTGESEYFNKTVEISVENCRVIKKLIKKTAEYSSGFSEKERNIDLNRVTDMILGLLERELEKRDITVRVDFCDNAIVEAYRGRIQELIYHLVNNAISSMTNGGTLAMAARVENGMIVLDVINTGPGFAGDFPSTSETARLHDENQESIQEPLPGLMIARKIVLHCKGAFEVKNSENANTVSVSLPASKDRA